MVEKIGELSKNGYCIKMNPEKYGEYIATHEFAHSLIDMESPLKNYIGMDVKQSKEIRKQIKEIYQEYMNDIANIESQIKEIKKDKAFFDFSVSIEEQMKAFKRLADEQKKLEHIRISRYSMENADEFMAEAFAQAKIGNTTSTYSNRIMEVIDNNFSKSVVKPDGSDIIKNITIEDFKDAAIGKEVQPEILDVINDNCKDKGMFFNDVVIEKIADEDGRKVLLQTEPYFGGQRTLTRLKINESVFEGRSLEEIDKRIKESPNTLANNLQEAVWHENGHAKTYFNKTLDEIQRINKELEDIHYDELSFIASQNGSELIAEIEILLRRGENVPHEAMEIYNKYNGG